MAKVDRLTCKFLMGKLLTPRLNIYINAVWGNICKAFGPLMALVGPGRSMNVPDIKLLEGSWEVP